MLGSFGFTRAEAAIPYDTMVSIGTLGGSYSQATGVSADGSIIVGTSVNTAGETRGFRYLISDPDNLLNSDNLLRGFTDPFNSAEEASVFAISGDGNIIVGQSYNQSHGIGNSSRYVGSDINPQNLLPSANQSLAKAASYDGSVIVGYRGIISRAFKYSADSGLAVDIGTLPGANQSSAYGVSANGAVIVGSSGNSPADQHAFRYTDSGMVDLHSLMGLTSSVSKALAISGDGSTIVGNYGDASDYRAFKYTDSGMTDLGTLASNDSYNSTANAVSYDGSVIVGKATIDGGGERAFRYVNGKMFNLGTLVGGGDSEALGVSADGVTVVGRAQTSPGGNFHAFIFKSKIVDIANTSTSLYYNGAQLNSIINARTFLMGNNLNQDCALFGSNNICVGIGGRYSGVTAHNTSEEAGVLKVAYKFNPNFRAGVMLDQVFNSEDPSNFVVSNPTPTVVVFTNLAQNAGGRNGYGFNFKLAASYNKSDLTIKRDAYLTNTEEGKGNASLISKGFLAQLSYNQKLTKRLDIIPSFGIRHSNVVRNAYTETSGADFPITYKALRQKSTTAIAGVGLNLWRSPGFNFSAGGGVERNLQSSIDGYAGTVSQMGSFSLKAASITQTRPYAELKFSYDPSNTRRFTASVYHGKQQFNSAYATTVYLMYMVGF